MRTSTRFYRWIGYVASVGRATIATTCQSDPAPARIFTRHNGLPGRARLQVAGLRGNDALRRTLEASGCGEGIRSISASAITGNILILYDPRRELPEIVDRLERFLFDPPPPPPLPPPPAAQTGGLMQILRGVFGVRPTPPPLSAPAPRRRDAGEGAAPETMPAPWHSADAAAVVRFWGAAPETGLAAAEAAARLEKYGANVLAPAQPRAALAILADQFTSLPVLLLAGSAALSIVTGGIADAMIIGAVIVLNAAIGFTTEYGAERTILSLLELSEPEARVLRDGRVQPVGGDEVVPGDVLFLSRGEAVAADARLIAATRLTVDEAALTGESLPVEKDPRAMPAATLLAERTAMVYRGTAVTGGQAVAIVVATGRHTEIGRIQALLADSVQPETPLQRQMRSLGARLTWAVCAVSGAMFALGLLRGFSPFEMLRSAISLAIAAVPEGLPVVATVCLANGMRSLLRHKVLARRLAAIEALGGVRTLCFDKTGTLTWNRMSAVAVFAGMRRFEVSGAAFLSGAHRVDPSAVLELSKLLEVCSLCSEAAIDLREGEWAIEGSPTESALVRMALDCGFDVAGARRRHPLLEIGHRTETQRYMTTVHELAPGRHLAAVKGSPADVLALCGWHASGGAVRDLGDAERRRILAANDRMAGSGLRVLGFACRERAGHEPAGRFVWLGLAGMADPPRHGLREAIAGFRRAGVRPLMLTGDQAATAESVAATLGLNGGAAPRVLRAAELDALPPGELAARLRDVTVFSRVTPSHKLQIVRALQSGGATVAMTGDGVNDAPALKAADVGIALGRGGTKVARGVADLLLMDDDLAALLPAIRDGRAVRENLRRAVHYVAATNASEVLTMLACVGGGLGQPFNPRQLLWINLMTDVFPELALALERPGPDLLARPPRDPSEPVLGRDDYARLGRQSGVMTAAAVGAYAFGLARYGAGPRAGTLAFLTLTSAQLLHGFSARSETRGADLPPNAGMTYGLLAGFGLLVASQFVPGLGALLGTARVGLLDALVCAGGAFASLLAIEAMKPAAGEISEKEKAIDGDLEWVN